MAVLDYNLSITGDCQNTSSGILQIYPIGGSESIYTVDWYNPNLGVDTTVTLGNSSERTGLSAGTYQVLVTDSTTPVNQQIYINLFVSSGICLTTSSTNTNCNGDNGLLIVTATTLSSPVNYNLYSLTNGYVTSASTGNGYQIFNSLSADTYYVECFDNGGCSGSTATCIIKSSDTFDYGFFIINDSNCLSHTGKIYITGQTGVPPYTYLWNYNNQTTSSISGLTAGNYSVTVTDSTGCEKSKSATVTTVQPVGIVTFLLTQPDCFQANGSITAVLSGGSAPYYCSLSNGDSQYTFLTNPTFTGLTTGTYTLNVTDAGLCTTSGVTSLFSPNSFAVVGVSTNSTNCGQLDGSISINVVGGATPYTYKLTDSLGNIRTSGTSSPSLTFNGLSAGTYQITVTNPSNCEYQTTATLFDYSEYRFTATTKSTKCGLNNGEITITVDTPGSYKYQINGQLIDTTNTSVTFTDLTPGLYDVIIRNQTGCRQSTQVTVGSSINLNLILNPTSCGTGNEGTIDALITGGYFPITFEWSPNVNGQTGVYVEGLTAGTYSLKITDASGCTAFTQTTVTCTSQNSSYELFNVCEDTFTDTPSTKLGVYEMFNQGYYELTKGNINCILNYADFIINLNVGGTAYTSNFYTTTSLNDYPTDQEYVDALTTLLATVPNLGAITLDLETNLLNLNTDCTFVLDGVLVTIKVDVEYDICCESYPDCIVANYVNQNSMDEFEVVFVSSGTINGYPSWNATILSCSVTIFFNNSTNRWETTGLALPCGLSQLYRYGSPLGEWVDTSNIVSLSTTPDTSNTCVIPSPTPTQTPTKTPTPTPTQTLTPTPTPTRIPCLLQVSLSGTNPTYGSNNGSITATTTGNYGPVTYLWSPGGQTTSIINGLSGGNYTVTVTDTSLAGCSKTKSLPIYQQMFMSKGGNISAVTRMRIRSTSYPFNIDWGDGNVSGYTSGSIQSINHNYSSPNSNQITLQSYNLSDINLFEISGVTPLASSVSYYPFDIDTTEAQKLNKTLWFVMRDVGRIKGLVSELPISAKTMSLYYGQITGNTSDLPRGLLNGYIYNFNNSGGITPGNKISGSTSNLPPNLNVFEITGDNTISGNTSQLPTSLTWMIIEGYNTISGNTSNFPPNLTYLGLYGENTVSGSLSGLSNSLTNLIISGKNTVTGNTSSLTGMTGLLRLQMAGFSDIGGSVSNLPKGITRLQFVTSAVTQTNTLTGNVSDLPSGLTKTIINTKNTISGNTTGIPTGSTYFSIGGQNTITGDLSNIPATISSLFIGGSNTINQYTSPNTWPATMYFVKVTSNVGGYGFSSTELDNIFNDLSGATWSISNDATFGSLTKVIELYGVDNPKVTNASLTSRNHISGTTGGGQGVTITLY